MAVTKTILQNSPTRTTIKIIGTAADDTNTIVLKATVTYTSVGNLTFTAGSNGTGTIVRSTGSWATDIGTITNQVYVTFTGTTSNNKTFSILSVGGTGNNTITVKEDVTAEVVTGATTPTGYKSDVGFAGQEIGTPKVNINTLKYAMATNTGILDIKRNAVQVYYAGGYQLSTLEMTPFTEQNGSDVVVLFTTSGGTCILELSKISGFGNAYATQDIWRP